MDSLAFIGDSGLGRKIAAATPEVSSRGGREKTPPFQLFDCPVDDGNAARNIEF
jgi:hypothetical protein